MVRRVLEQGWSLAEAAEAAGVERAHVREVGRALSGRGRGRVCWIAPRRRGRSRTARREERVEAIAALRRLRMTGAEIAMLSGDGALDGLGGPDADRAGQALAAWSRPSRRTATSARRPGELIHVDVKKLGAHRAAPGIA